MKTITKKFLKELKNMTKEQKMQKIMETGNMLYCLDADKCLKEFYGE